MPRFLRASFCWFTCLLLASVGEPTSQEPQTIAELLAANPLGGEVWLDEARAILRREFGAKAEAE